jgi:hypothetical protein
MSDLYERGWVMLTDAQREDLRLLVLYGQEDREEATRRLLEYVESVIRMRQIELLTRLRDAADWEFNKGDSASFDTPLPECLKLVLNREYEKLMTHQPQSAPDNGGEEVNEP